MLLLMTLFQTPSFLILHIVTHCDIVTMGTSAAAEDLLDLFMLEPDLYFQCASLILSQHLSQLCALFIRFTLFRPPKIRHACNQLVISRQTVFPSDS